MWFVGIDWSHQKLDDELRDAAGRVPGARAGGLLRTRSAALRLGRIGPRVPGHGAGHVAERALARGRLPPRVLEVRSADAAHARRHVAGRLCLGEGVLPRATRFGHRHHESLRAVAHKWVKIILAMRKAGEPYDESRFLDSRRHNPVTSSPADPEIAVLAQGSLT